MVLAISLPHPNLSATLPLNNRSPKVLTSSPISVISPYLQMAPYTPHACHNTQCITVWWGLYSGIMLLQSDSNLSHVDGHKLKRPILSYLKKLLFPLYFSQCSSIYSSSCFSADREQKSGLLLSVLELRYWVSFSSAVSSKECVGQCVQVVPTHFSKAH